MSKKIKSHLLPDDEVFASEYLEIADSRPQLETDKLGAILDKVKNLRIMARVEYDFKYGDGSGNTAYDVAKLKAIESRGLKALKSELNLYIRGREREARIDELD